MPAPGTPAALKLDQSTIFEFEARIPFTGRRADEEMAMPSWRQVFISEGLFGVLDEGDIATESADFSNGLVAPMASGAFIMTGINTGYVRVETRVLDTPPDVENGDWEEIIEVSVHAPAGDLKVESLELGPDADSAQSLSPSGPAWYRLRVHARGREILRDKVSIEPVEDYLLVAWQAPPGDATIIRTSK
ncbi:hypothetical protein [Streptomyces sp. NPDC058335]|uniref:hypothetical protein n=1 Tax=Streptomyces sp. NPDC058335 TaxID=3346451 RepID=UPI0036514AE1